MQKFRPKCCQRFQFSPFLGQKSPKIVIGYSDGTVVPPNDVSTSKKFLEEHWSFFGVKKNFRPRRAPTCRIFGQNDPKIYRFSPKIDHFWTFSGLWSPKMSLAPWKFFWEQKIVFFTPENFFGRAGRPHAEISAKMTPKFTVLGSKSTFLDFFGPVEPENGLSTMKNFLVAQNSFFFTRKKIFGHAGHPPAEISAKMTPKFGVFGQKQQILESFWPKFRRLGVRRGRKKFFE